MKLENARNVTQQEIELRRQVLSYTVDNYPIRPVEVIDVTKVLEPKEGYRCRWLSPGSRVFLIYASDPQHIRWYVELMEAYRRSYLGFVPLNDLTWKESTAWAIQNVTGLCVDELRELITTLIPDNIKQFL